MAYDYLKDKGVAAVSVIKEPLHVHASYELNMQGFRKNFILYQQSVTPPQPSTKPKINLDYLGVLIVMFGKSYTPVYDDY